MHDVLIYIYTHAFTLALIALAYALGIFFLFYVDKSYYLVVALLLWFPFETIFLRYIPIDYYAFGKYIPEVVLYSTALVSWIRYLKKSNRLFPRTPLNKWLGLYCLAAVASLAFNWYNPAIWLLGVRQIVRFFLVFVVIILEEFPYSVIKKFLWVGVGIALFEALLALAQYITHGALDRYLFFSDTVSLDGVKLEGQSQYWAPGQRVFATLGRYDRLGSFLVLIILMYFPWLYRATTAKDKFYTSLGFGVLLLALVLTYSRASWLGCLAGIAFMAQFVVRDKRLVRYLVGAGLIGVLAIGFVIITNNYGGGILDKQSQTISERAVEAFSWYSWKQNYEGYGRFFFLVNTPLMVVRHYPLFGVGPGNYGGGVAAALLNTNMYDRLHLPFGIQNTVGQIDSNWMSIWGEVGTVGLIAWFGLFVEIMRGAGHVAKRSRAVFQRSLAQGLMGASVALIIFGFFGPYFEMRTLMMYFWAAAGIIFHYARQEKLQWNFLKD